MKNSFLTFIILILASVSFGQVFISKQSDRLKSYNCIFRINKDSTVNFIYDSDFNGVYAEHIGTIKKLNDTLFRVKTTMTIGQFYMKSFHKDTIYIQLDSMIATQLDKISIAYTDGKTRKHLQGYDRNQKPIKLLKIPVDKQLFNHKKGSNYITIMINRRNFITDNFLTFKIPFGSAASFTSGQKNEFDIVIKNNNIWTVGLPPTQTGHFKLNKKKGT